MSNFLLFVLIFCFISSCGVNFFKPMEGKNPSDEQERLDKQNNKDPESNLKRAKEKLPQAVQTTLTKIEDLISKGTAYKNLDPTVLKELEEAIFKDDPDLLKNLEEGKKIKKIKEYSAVIGTYSKSTAYSEVNFIEVLLKSTSSDDSNSNLTLLAESCPNGMDVFLSVARDLRKHHCNKDGTLHDLGRLEILTKIEEALYINKETDGSYNYSPLWNKLNIHDQNLLKKLMNQDDLKTYLVSLFLQLNYVACEFVTNDCSIDESKATLNGLIRIWHFLLQTMVLENSLKESNLLPANLNFSVKKIVGTITEEAKTTAPCQFGTEPIPCTLLKYISDAGKSCQIEKKQGYCEAIKE